MSPYRLMRHLPFLMLILFMISTGNCQTRVTAQQYTNTVQRSDRAAPREENLDPARANPVRNITCLGDSLNLRLPMLGNFDPNQVSVQKICAKPQYNGGAPYEHAGGYCSEPPFAPYTGDIAFDRNANAHANRLLQNPRVLLACRYRCFCNWNIADTSIQPKTNLRGRRFEVESLQSQNSYELRLDVNDDFTTPRRDHLGQFGVTRVDTLRLLRQTQLSKERGYSPYRNMYDYISLDPGNKVVCSGDMPTFHLPQPYTHWDFITLGPNPVQKLCATQLSGGAKGANAGAYCYRSDTPFGPRSDVWFSDSMTPRLDWTWSGGNFLASATIRFFCWQHCTCTSDRNTANPKANLDNKTIWPLLPGHSFMQMPDGSYYIVGTGSKGNLSSMQILPSQGRGMGSRSGHCGVNGTDFCPSTWDQETLGPVPLVPPNTTDIIKPTPKGNSTVCGNTCHGPSDCGSTTSQYSCSCAFPSSDDARKLGLDPVAPAAVCLALFITSVQSNLGGRDIIPAYVDARGVPHTCRCSETRTGAECCGAVNGLRPTKLLSSTLDRTPSNRTDL